MESEFSWSSGSALDIPLWCYHTLQQIWCNFQNFMDIRHCYSRKPENILLTYSFSWVAFSLGLSWSKNWRRLKMFVAFFKLILWWYSTATSELFLLMLLLCSLSANFSRLYKMDRRLSMMIMKLVLVMLPGGKTCYSSMISLQISHLISVLVGLGIFLMISICS